MNENSVDIAWELDEIKRLLRLLVQAHFNLVRPDPPQRFGFDRNAVSCDDVALLFPHAADRDLEQEGED